MTQLKRDSVRAHAAQTPTIRCTLGDMLVCNLPVPVVFFYDRLLDADTLAHGLGRVIGDYCVFNGKLVQRGSELFLDCSDIGVSLSVVESDTTMLQAMSVLDTPARLELVEMINAKRALAKGEPVLTVRVTHFADGKSALGVCWHHAVGDMHTFMHLMQAWSKAVAGLDYDKPLVVEDRVAYLDSALPSANRAKPGVRYLGALELAGLAMYMLTKARDQRLLSFYFGPRELQSLRASLQSQCSERLSMNDALSAHMFSLVADSDPKPRGRHLGIAVNFRKRVGLPENLLGNMITGINLWSEPGKPANDVARDLRRSVDRFADEHMDYHATKQFVSTHGGEAKVSRFVMKAIDPVSGSLLITNWTNFGVYSVGFGGAGPRYFVGIGEVPFPWLSSVYEGFDNQGAVFGAVLPRAIADRLADGPGLQQVHRFRDDASELPKLAAALPWMR